MKKPQIYFLTWIEPSDTTPLKYFNFFSVWQTLLPQTRDQSRGNIPTRVVTTMPWELQLAKSYRNLPIPATLKSLG